MDSEEQPDRPIRKRAPRQSSTTARDGGVTDGNGAAVVRALDEAGQSMSRSLYQINLSLQERQIESAQRYQAALQSTLEAVEVNDINAAYGAYVNALASLDGMRISETRAAYVDLLLKFSVAANQQADFATKTCVADNEQALAEARSEAQQQYNQYLDTLRSVFSRAEEADLRPDALFAVAQNIAAAAAAGTAVFGRGE